MSIEIDQTATEMLKAMVEGRCGKRQIERFLRAVPGGWRWKPLRGFHTLSTVTTGEMPAVTELMTNSIDANIRLRATERAIETGRPVSGPDFNRMFGSPRHASEELFGIPGGELAKWKDNQASLASLVASLILELGSSDDYRRNPTVKIVDRGIGQSASRFCNTFLNTTEGDKGDCPWEAGTYGIGSVVAARVCPYQLVVSKRAPSVLPPGADEPWGILVIRTELVSNEAGERMKCSVLVYGDDGQERFPTLPPGTELHVSETYFVRHCKRHLSESEKATLVREKEGHCRQNRGEVVKMTCEILEPTKEAKKKRGVVERARIVARRPLAHGTVRMLVDTEFTETWIRQPLGGKSGIFRKLERVIPDPILPFLVVENRFASGIASIETGERNALPMFGRTSALSKVAGEPIYIPVDGIEIDHVDMGSVDVSIYYSPDGFSDSLGGFAKLPRLVRAGQVTGDGDTHTFAEMIGFSKFTDRFACLVSIDRLRDDPRRLSKICSAGRTCPDNKAVSKLWGKIVSAVRNNDEMRRIRAELQRNMPKSNELARQISRVLGGAGDGEDGEVILSSKNRIPVCVKGTDMPKTDNLDFVWVNREPRFSGRKRCLETLKPVRLERGKSATMGIATSSRKKVNFARKSSPYKLEAYTEGGGGVEAKIVKNSLVVTANRVAKNAKPVTVIVYVTTDSGFKSVPGVVKVLPIKPRPRVSLRPEPTFVKVNEGFANKKLPVGKAEVVRFKSDADSSFAGFSGEARFGKRVFSVHAEGVGRGQGRAYIPALNGAQVGDVCLLSIVAKGDDGNDIAACSAELVVVAEKPAVGIEAIKKRNERSKIDAPGDTKGLRIEFEEAPGQWGLSSQDSEAEIVVHGQDGELIGVINKLAPTFMASMNGICEEATHMRKVEDRDDVFGLERDYYDRVSVAIRDIVGEMTEAKEDERKKIRAGAARELRRVARSHPLMFHFDRVNGVKYARYIKYAEGARDSEKVGQ